MKIFFQGLNELRGIAALSVVFHHVELFKHREKLGGMFETGAHDFIQGLGKNGVYLFFVLSGFLITYLLLAELKKSDTIRVGYFYLRRLFRIWPLYYFIVLLGFFALPLLLQTWPGFFGGNYYAQKIADLHTAYGSTLLLFLLFLPNLALILYSPVAGASHAWSVGVEEQFYLIWPVILKTFRHHILLLLLFILLGKPLSLLAMEYLALKNQPAWSVLYQFLDSLKIELMAMGGIGAWLLHRGFLAQLIQVANRWYTVILLLILAPALYFNMHYFLMGVLFLLLILLNVQDRSRLISNKQMAFLGDISYGIYMYHPIVMYLAFCTARALVGLNSPLWMNVLFYGLTFGGTVLVSYFSFTYLESYFMRFKNKFVVIESGKL